MFIINEAEEKDLQAIFELEKELFLEEKWSYFQLLEEFKNRFSKIWVLKKEGEVTGYLIFREFPPEIEIFKIGIKRKHQRKGLGTKLLQKLIEVGKGKKISKIFLEVKASNLQAYNFYKKMGFKVFYKRKNYYGKEEALVMLKEI